RAAGDTVWLSETAPAADGGLSLLGYVTDTDVELRAVALAEDGTASAPTESVTHTVGGASADRPDALDDAAVGVTGGMGHARITVAVNDDNATTHLVLYRVPQGDTLDPDAHAFGAAVAVTRGTTAVMIDGDATRSNLLGNPDFADVSVWSAGTGWTIASGAATHAAGAAGDLSQPVTLNDGAVVRLGLAVSGRSAGVLTPQLSGGTAQSAAGADSNARHVATLTVDSNTSLTLSADSAFDGAVDDVVLFVQTAACAPQGAWDYYIAPQNVEGVTAAASGPFSVVID
ncbi:MAG: hypothetical protein ACPGFC_09800, partial [Paracoccaceae bacterium]